MTWKEKQAEMCRFMIKKRTTVLYQLPSTIHNASRFVWWSTPRDHHPTNKRLYCDMRRKEEKEKRKLFGQWCQGKKKRNVSEEEKEDSPEVWGWLMNRTMLRWCCSMGDDAVWCYPGNSMNVNPWRCICMLVVRFIVPVRYLGCFIISLLSDQPLLDVHLFIHLRFLCIVFL